MSENKKVKFQDSPKKNNKNINQDKKLEQLNQEKKNYIKLIYAMQSELFSFKNKMVNINKLESEIKIYQNKNTNLENEIKNLQNEILELKEKYNEELRQKDNYYLEEIRKLKVENENIKNKIGITNELTREKNGLLKAFNILLKEKEDLIVEHDNNLKQKELNTQIKLAKLKKKMIDSVNETQAKSNELNANYMDVSSKLTLLQNHQFLIQLEYQEQELNKLIEKNEALEKKLYSLKQDIQVHKEVEISLADKNKKLLERLKKLKEENNENEKEDEQSNSALNIGDTSEKNKNSSNRTIQLENKIINLEKKLQVKQKEYMELKDKSDSIENIFKNYEKKYSGLFKYFEESLEMFFNDEELKNIKDIYINIELMKKGDFSNLNYKEKYSTLIILMKYLMPLIYNTEYLPDFNTMNNINVKFYSKMKKIKISKINNNINNNINQNVFKRMLNKKKIIPELVMKSNIKYNSFDDLPDISKRTPLSPLISPKNISINLKKMQ